MSMFENFKPLDPRELVVCSQIREDRLDICRSCDKFNGIQFCSLCKCFMPAKTWLVNASCPIKKWSNFENE